LRPVFEAYLVLADALVDVDFRRDALKDELVAAALALGTQYRLQRTIRSAEAVSTVLFHNAMHLAGNRELLSGGDLATLQAREEFASDLGAVVELLGEVERLRA